MDRGKMKKEKGKEVEKIKGRGREEKKKEVDIKFKEKEKKGKEKSREVIVIKRKEDERRKEPVKTMEKAKEQFKGKQEKNNDGDTLLTTLPPPPAPEEKNKILVLGLDGAGKTSLLYSLASHKIQQSVTPTQGFNEVCITIDNNQMKFLEIGGSEPYRSQWEMHLSKGLLLIFVVDSADHNRLGEAKKYLHQLIKANPVLPLVVFAHKQDLEAAYRITDIHDALELSQVGNNRKLFLFGSQVTECGSDIPSTLQDAKDLIAHLAANYQ
ncbi:PREDICTED: ADP-ribosylation factor-like protein 9 [Dipodomys ordii]|uniref:ADP-ribosylation factor-like protein 9 n=1 Tax=Dipodomys ordii TaxID=10020 RepID=A0A1S3ELS7_DIPOR|nr:PREDICTED: ADP-ribosylation factor-like protein 9 [Dipodomys ordii]